MEKKLDASILALGSKIINAEIKMQTLKELLIEKEIVSQEELNEKYQFVMDRDFDKFKSELNESLRKYANK